MGASSAAWPPASMTWSMARTAITVLPEPTSPCSSRCMGNAQARSDEIVSPAAHWPAVRLNGSRESNASASPPDSSGRGVAGSAAAASRRWARAACSTKASSHLSRCRALR